MDPAPIVSSSAPIGVVFSGELPGPEQDPDPRPPPGDIPHHGSQGIGFFPRYTDGFLLTQTPSSSILTSPSLDGFYTYFFPAHPFVLPRAQFTQQFDADSNAVSELLVAMTLIGALYTRDAQSHISRQHAEQALEKTLPATGFAVQALMLFALCLEWCGEGDRAGEVLGRARTVALQIGLHRQGFAADYGQGNPVLEECWRRTWWELYVVDALFAGIRHWPSFSLCTMGADVYLPSDEELYVPGVSRLTILLPSLPDAGSANFTKDIPPLRTLKEYDDRCFEERAESFSSFTYLIDAARILGTTLAAGDIAGGSPMSLVKNAEANIMSWDLHLPQCKRDPVKSNGHVDEVLFRAHLMINT